ncbi:MAG: sigma-70 family RNA polymerase sigma factor [Bdellovibrionia bacterium]
MYDLKLLNDEDLMKEYQRGSELAFAILYKRHSAKIYGFLLGKLRDRAFTDDVFQATFLKLHQSRDKYDARFPFTPWLFTVCRNEMIDGIRKRKRTAKIFDEFSDPIKIEQAMAPEPQSPLSIPSFDGLPDSQREVLQLRFGNELSFDEIAQKLKTTPSNVRQLTSRAVRKLKALFDLGGEKK